MVNRVAKLEFFFPRKPISKIIHIYIYIYFFFLYKLKEGGGDFKKKT